MDWYWWPLIALAAAGFAFFAWCLCAISDRMDNSDR